MTYCKAETTDSYHETLMGFAVPIQDTSKHTNLAWLFPATPSGCSMTATPVLVRKDSICRMSSFTDENDIPLFEHDTVQFLSQTGTIVIEADTFGISFPSQIDWNAIQTQIKTVTGQNNSLMACMNDNFISLWEIAWNFNVTDDNALPCVTKIDTPPAAAGGGLPV